MSSRTLTVRGSTRRCGESRRCASSLRWRERHSPPGHLGRHRGLAGGDRGRRGHAGGCIAAIGFFRTSQLDTLSSLSSVRVATLLLILVGMPLVAVIGGWLLAGREPSAIGRLPLD